MDLFQGMVIVEWWDRHVLRNEKNDCSIDNLKINRLDQLTKQRKRKNLLKIAKWIINCT